MLIRLACLNPGLKNHQEEIELDLIVIGLEIIIFYYLVFVMIVPYILILNDKI
jgi:hypothetical protein